MSRADPSKHRRALTPCLDPDRLGLTQSRQAVAWTFDPVDNKTKVLLLGSYRSLLANLSERYIYIYIYYIHRERDRDTLGRGIQGMVFIAFP